MKRSKMAYRGLALMLILIIILLTACGTTSEPTNTSNNGLTTNTPDNESQVSEQTEVTDPLGKYEETIVVTQVLGYNPPQDPKTPSGLTPENNGYVQALKDMLNIENKYLWTVPTDQFDQKFALAVSSGQLPDIMQVNLLDFENFRQQGQLADLTEAYEKYASPTLRRYLESDGGRTLQMFTYDGKLLGLPSYEDPFMSTQLMWIRTDWLENLQLEVPTNLEELEQVALAFVNNDPDGNQKNDTYGISLNKELVTWGFDARGLFNTMGAYPKAWIKDENGQLVAGEILPETKTTLELLNRWYENGILDKEFAFKDINKAVEDVVASKVGIAFGEWWYPEWPLNLNRDNDPAAEWKAFPLPSYNGNPGLSLVPGMRLNWVAVANKDFEHPEAIVKMANLYHELLKSEYDDLNKPENGFVYNWYEPRIYNPENINDIFMEVSTALKANQTEFTSENPEAIELFHKSKSYLDGEGDNNAWGFYNARAAEDGGWGLTKQVKEAGLFVYNEFAGTPTETQSEKGSSLDKMIDETFTKMIMGSMKISEFDSFVDSWKKLGGDDITEEINEWYKNRQ